MERAERILEELARKYGVRPKLRMGEECKYDPETDTIILGPDWRKRDLIHEYCRALQHRKGVDRFYPGNVCELACMVWASLELGGYRDATPPEERMCRSIQEAIRPAGEEAERISKIMCYGASATGGRLAVLPRREPELRERLRRIYEVFPDIERLTAEVYDFITRRPIPF